MPFTPIQPNKGFTPYVPGQNFKTDIVKPTDLQTKLDNGNYGDQVGGAQLSGAKKIAGSISKGAQDIQKGAESKNILSGIGNTIKGVAEAGFGTISGAAEIAFSPVTPAIRAITKTITPVLRQQNPELAKAYDTLAPKFDALAKKHPDSATLIGDMLNTALLAYGGGKGEVPIKNAAEDLLSKESLGAVKSDIASVPGKIKDVIKKPVVPETMAGKIIQGTTEDIPRATGPLSKIDISKVKTYEDLSSSLSKKVETDSAALDTKLDTNKTVTKLKDLTLPEKVGDKTISHNYIKDSIAQLKDYYSSINDNAALAKIKQLEAKATKEGLTVKEINNLAKEQGTSIEAYKRNGDLASSTKAKAAENTRTGVKSTGRKIFGDKAYGEADKALSDTMRTRDLADKMTEAVNKAKQKMVDRSIPQKVATLIGKVIDTVTGGSIKGLVKGLGLKVDESATMSALDLEKSLSKNLTKFQDAMSAKTEAEMTKKLEAMIVDPAATPPEVFTGKVKPLTGVNNTIEGSVPVKNAPKGHYLNIVMKVGTTNEPITVSQIKAALPKDVKILNSKIIKGEENTFVPQLSRPLTENEMNDLLAATKQKAIPQLSNGEGKMYGSNEWGDFNPEYFYGKDGKPLTTKLKGKLKP